MSIFCRMIAPEWLLASRPDTRKVLEGLFSEEQIAEHNRQGYNIYCLPNSPSNYSGGTVNGSQINRFEYVFVDCDLKDRIYPSKEAFVARLAAFSLPPHTVVDSGNGVHAYWNVADLDPMSYLRLSRRLMRFFKTDEAVGQLFQLMRLPGTMNTKKQGAPVPCEVLSALDKPEYLCEQLDQALPPISLADEQYCEQHYNRTHSKPDDVIINDRLPAKFGKLLQTVPEARTLFLNFGEDRSKSDYRLAHVMFANGFTKEEATSVLVNTAKSLERSEVHRLSYATNIVDKIWTYEVVDKSAPALSQSVKDILAQSVDAPQGTRFACHPRIDNTKYGFRLGHVIGLVAGSGVGKTSFALNMFRWFAQNNPNYVHFFVPLEQESYEIASRWQTMCGPDTSLHEKVHILSNYAPDGSFRHLSLNDIKEYILKFQEESGQKVGCVVIDHIGALKRVNTKEEKQGIVDICHEMKAFAVQTKTLVVMQSQTSREKAGIGDLELNKDAAYGTMWFESYCDFLVTLWQPLKRCHHEAACPTVTAFKFCKIRHKKPKHDVVQEDVPYFLYFDSDNEHMRDMTQDEIQSFNYFLPKATNKRKQDRKTEILTYTAVPYAQQVDESAGKSVH